MTTEAGEVTVEAIGTELTFYPYEEEHKVTPVFVPLSDSDVARTVTIAEHEGGQIVVTSGGEVLEVGEGGAITVARGSELTFEAVPNAYYNFIGWTENFEDYGDDTTSVTMRVLDNLTVGASFEADLLYTLEFGEVEEAGGGGELSATADGAQLTSGAKLVPQTQIDFAAKADEGSRFTKWGIREGASTVTTFVNAGEGLVTEDSYELALRANSSVDAYFKAIEKYDLVISPSIEHGSVVVDRDGQPVVAGQGSLSYGDVITINAEPDDDYILTSLMVNGEDFTPGDTLLVTGPVTIDATIVENHIHFHAWGEPAWTWEADNSAATATFACGCGEKRVVDATLMTAPEPDATCTTDGRMVITATVSFEGKSFADKRDGEVIYATNHAWGEPTWEWAKDGSSAKAVFECANSAACTEEVSAKVSSAEGKAPTCTEGGSTVYTAEVEFDGKLFSAETELSDVPAAGHESKLVGAKEPTCTAEGYTGDEICSVCGDVVRQGEAIDALPHEAELVGAVDPTEWEVGYSGDTVCSVCGEVLAKGEKIDTLPVESEVMYRLYNRWTGEHFYTSSQTERASLVRVGWTDEGVGWVAPLEGEPVWRLYNPYAEGGDHHYTMSEGEYDALAKLGWKKEGICWRSAPADSVASEPVLRQYNPYATSGTHNYTVSEAERDALVKIGWIDEDVAWYAVR